MPVEKWSDSVVVARLADNPHLPEDLEALDQMTQSGRKLDAVIDFSGIKFLNSSNLAKLLKLRRQMAATESRLVLCGTNTQVWGAFLVTNLDKMFQFSDDVPTALATLQLNAKPQASE